MDGQRCKHCRFEEASQKNRYTIEEVQKIFEEKNCILITNVYKNNSTELEYYCKKHMDKGKQFTILQYFNSNKYPCKYCYEEERMHDLDFAIQIFDEKGCILLEDKYVKSTHLMRCICKKHSKKGIQKISLVEIQKTGYYQR